jgi:hypothetical protein
VSLSGRNASPTKKNSTLRMLTPECESIGIFNLWIKDKPT